MHDPLSIPHGAAPVASTTSAPTPHYATVRQALAGSPRKWLVTGAAGFIGSHLVEELLKLGQRVVGLDNFSTGHRRNIQEVQTLVTGEQWAGFRLVDGDIRRPEDCQAACAQVDYVLHQAALGSVPRSLQDPSRSHANNVDGFLNMAVAARDAKVKRFVYASSSSVYGDHPALPKVEANTGRPLSPYAATKLMNETYAGVFARCYGLTSVGLRYFNVFGPRQDPEGAYAAVVPKWFAALLQGQDVFINGDGETSRDFCYIDNVVQANLLAATAALQVPSLVLNVACGDRATLNELFARIRELVAQQRPTAAEAKPVYREERAGDIRHSLADITAARSNIGYAPQFTMRSGLERAFAWYRNATNAACAAAK